MSAALTWELVARHRWMTALAAALLLLSPLLPTVGALYAGAAAAALVLAVAGHAFEGPVEGRASLFPRRLFVLPASSWGLILPPMLLASAALLAGGGLLTLGGYPPWPGVLAAALTAWMQALLWTPMPLPWLRLGLIVALMPVAVGAAVAADRLSPGPLEVGLLALAAVAYAAARAGVGRARQGVGLGEPAREVTAARERPRFATPADALMWLEWRRLWVLTLLGGGMAASSAVPIMVGLTMALRSPELRQLTPFAWFIEAFGPGWVAASPALLMPLLMASFGGGDLGRLRERYGTLDMPASLASKPVASGLLLAVKLRLVTLTSLITWGVAWLLVFAWSAATGELAGMAERLHGWFGPAWPAALLGVAAGLLVVSWLWLARSLWTGLWRYQGAMVGPVACGFLFPSAVVLGQVWLAALALAVEAACMAPLARHSRRKGVIAVIALVSVATTAAGWWPVAALVWPFAGLLLAPTAIERNRHR